MKKLIVWCWVFIVFFSSVIAAENDETLASDEAPASDAPAEKRWPREIKVSNAEITIYQPQLETFDKNVITSRAAVAVKRNDSDKTDYCAIWMKAIVDTDKETRMVKLRDLSITKMAYPDASEKVKASLSKIIRDNILKADMSISLDRLLAMMDAVEKQNKEDTKFDNKVPEFFFSKEAAVLVNIDGAPVMSDLGNGISQVANTRYLIAEDTSSKKYYLKCAENWFASEKIMGPWTPVTDVPDAIAALGKKEDSTEKTEADDVIPKIFVTTKPAELIQSYGEPEVAKIPGTDLSYLENSDNDVFRDDSTMKLYVLASGRWFTADKKEGPWSFISADKLPADFTKIPADSSKADVLASVPGTETAKDAVMESYIPQTATIKRGSVALDIEYDGEPDFQPIDGTSMSYAANTQTPVVKLNNKYYACDNGAWYESSSPKGNWDVCVNVPDEIYNIPPSCPIYNSTFVKVYNYNDDTVDVGYTSGYDDSYVNGGVVVYGTGYWYRPWWRHHWWPRPVTYGWRYRYDRHNGRWHRYDRYRDRHGRYVSWNHRYNPKTLPLPNRAEGDYRGKQIVARNYNAYKYNKGTLKTASRQYDTRRTTATVKANVYQKSHANNVYVGNDGKIYRHGLDGWQNQNKGHWQTVKPTQRITQPLEKVSPRPTPQTRPVQRPTTPTWQTRPTHSYHNDLNVHYNSRQRGNYRTSEHFNYSRSHSYSGGRSYGGMSRGGGGGRGGRR